MKNLIKLFIAVAALIFIFSFTPKKNQHVGIWKGIDQGKTGYFIFDSAGFTTIEIEGQKMGGKSFVQNGIAAQMKCVVDYNTKPISIDLVITVLETGEEALRAKGIIEFLSADKMKMSLDLNSADRPTSFQEGKTLILTREK